MKLLNSDINIHLRDRLTIFLLTNKLSSFLFGKNRSIIFNRSITRKIIEYYDGDKAHNIDRYYGNLGFGLIHYSLILNLKPGRILCVGSRKGFIPAICALACQENSFGQVDFVDAGYGLENKNNWSGIGFWKKINPEKHFSFLETNKYLKTYIMTSEEFAKKYKKRTYQYIYIDGDHSYEGVKKDFNLFWSRLEKGGLMVFHDVTVKEYPGLPKFGVWKFWQEVKGEKISIPLTQSGLGILQKT
ncbi:MAG: class I SAM-dependent methyltransferase [bacterium]|nr:class I SAM-dependent methyltransferase [bacterium]